MKKGLAPKDKIKSLVKKDYPDFIKELNSTLLTASKEDRDAFKKTINDLVTANKVNYKPVDIPVSALKPTQDEIGMNESLKYVLENKDVAKNYLTCGDKGVLVVREILTTGGKLIIDGHHRWSQVYAINPACKIKAKDLEGYKDEKDAIPALKAAQLGIAANEKTDKLPSSSAKGVNLLDSKVTAATVKDEIKKIIKDDVLAVFAEKKLDTKDKVADYIWGNIEKMRTNNNHVAGAPNRNLMPQTDAESVNKIMDISKIAKKF